MARLERKSRGVAVGCFWPRSSAQESETNRGRGETRVLGIIAGIPIARHLRARNKTSHTSGSLNWRPDQGFTQRSEISSTLLCRSP